jgi:uncharacterized protein (TIGR02145 family)
MKKTLFLFSAVTLISLSLSSFEESPLRDTTSSIKEITVGNQVWMSENLNVDKFRNGNPIPQAKTAEEWKKAGDLKKPAWCYYNNDPANGSKYGKLYNWYAVNDSRGLAPVGWHIPSIEEWTILTDKLGVDWEKGKKMKSEKGWNPTNSGADGNGTNEIGFSALPGGSRSSFMSRFFGEGNEATWWCAHEYDKFSAMTIGLAHNQSIVISVYGNKENGLYVRCVKN